MRLIYLHGPPASGKYTIAKILESQIGARNFHNHLTIDVARSLFPYGSREFWELTRALRMLSLQAVAPDPDAIVVFTTCYSRPESDRTVAAMEELARESGGDFLPVFLQCRAAELEHRVTDPSRQGTAKISSVEDLRRFLDRWNCVPVPRPNCISVVSDGRSAEDCAREIERRLSLRSAPGRT